MGDLLKQFVMRLKQPAHCLEYELCLVFLSTAYSLPDRVSVYEMAGGGRPGRAYEGECHDPSVGAVPLHHVTAAESQVLGQVAMPARAEHASQVRILRRRS